MDRSKPPKARRLPQRVRKTALTLFAAMLGMAPQTASPAQAFADTTGTASPQIVIFYGTGETVHGEWREDTLTIDGKPAYCVEVDSEFKPGIDVSPCDPVAEGIWSQDICTKLALIDQFVKSGNYVSTKKGTGDGHRVTDTDEQYAVAQCYIWKFLNDAGYAKNHYGWFGAATVQGKDLTGSDTDDQIWEHVRKNIGQYRGSAKYYDCGDSQNLACSFSLSPVKGYISIKKRSADEDLTSKSGSYSLSGAQYGIFSSEECSENSLVATLETNDEGEAKSEALPAGNYFVKETRASAGFSIDPSCYPVEAVAGSETLVNAEAGCVFEQPGSGSITLQKRSSQPGISDGNACYSFEGALFGIYSDPDCKNLIAKAETDESGFFKVDKLPVGSCYVREISAPAGFAVNGGVFQTIVEDGKNTPVNAGSVDDTPKRAMPELLLEKHDAQLGSGTGRAQGGASLANAEFEVRFYAGSFDKAETAEQSGDPARTWIFKNDEDGRVPFDEAHLVSGDALYRCADGTPCIPLGTLVIRETTPPRGYLANTEAICLQITDDGSAGETVEGYQAPSIADRVKRGDVEFIKMSGSESNRLAGVPFVITSRETGEAHVIVTDENGKASTTASFQKHSYKTNQNDQLADGKQDDIQDSPGEQEPQPEQPDGSEGDPQPGSPDDENGSKPEQSEGDGDGKEESGDQKDDVPPVTDPPVDDDDSSDTEDKPSSGNGDPSQSDGAGGSDKPSQDDVPPVTDLPIDDDDSSDTDDSTGNTLSAFAETARAISGNGSSDEAGHSQEQESETANQNRGTVAQKAAQPTGVWFGSAGEGESPIEADDNMGALPFGSYTIEELPCKANEGLQLVNASVVISQDAQTVDLGYIDDPEASIATCARDGADGDKTLASSQEASIVDAVSFANLIPGMTYKLTGKVKDARTGKDALDANGEEITGETEFTPDAESGTAEVRFTFPSEGIEGSQLVVFETLSCKDRVIALHEDMEDSEQGIRIAQPAIGTQAFGPDGMGQHASSAGRTAITDTVSYSALVPGKEYHLSGSLANALTGETIAIDGEPICAELDFTPEQASGSTQLVFEFDAGKLGDTTKLVVFEKLFAQDRLLASHEDRNDPGQTIELVEPRIQTSLSESVSGSSGPVSAGEILLTDQVAYSNLTPGAEYKIEGRLIAKETGEAALDASGNPIASSCAFTPESPQGTAAVDFRFDGSDLDGSTLVAFESLETDGKIVAEHADLKSETQSVSVASPKVQTYASDAADQDQIIPGDGQAKITDTVSVTNATPGENYTLFGILMDKSTGLPLIQGPSGEGDAEEAVPEGRVARFWDAILAAAGRQESEGTESTGGASLDMEAIQKAMDEFPEVSSRIVTAQQDIAPDAPSFETQMDFEFSAQGLAGQTVVFEALASKESGEVIASHADLEDQAQTVEIEAPKASYPPSETKAINGSFGDAYDKTGNLIARYLWVLALIGAAGCASGAVALSRRRSRKRRKGIRC